MNRPPGSRSLFFFWTMSVTLPRRGKPRGSKKTRNEEKKGSPGHRKPLENFANTHFPRHGTSQRCRQGLEPTTTRGRKRAGCLGPAPTSVVRGRPEATGWGKEENQREGDKQARKREGGPAQEGQKDGTAKSEPQKEPQDKTPWQSRPLDGETRAQAHHCCTTWTQRPPRQKPAALAAGEPPQHRQRRTSRAANRRQRCGAGRQRTPPPPPPGRTAHPKQRGGTGAAKRHTARRRAGYAMRLAGTGCAAPMHRRPPATTHEA